MQTNVVKLDVFGNNALPIIVIAAGLGNHRHQQHETDQEQKNEFEITHSETSYFQL